LVQAEEVLPVLRVIPLQEGSLVSRAGETVLIDAGAEAERGVVANVGTGGATTTSKEVAAGEKTIPVVSPFGFGNGQTITIGSGSDAELVTVASIRRLEEPAIVVAAPLKQAHGPGSEVSGTGLTLGSALTRVQQGRDLV